MEFENIIEQAEAAAQKQAKEPIDLSQYFIDYTRDIPKPTPVIYDATNPDRIIVSEQNLFVIAGEAKSRKSFLASLLTIDFFRQHPDRNAILIDTEQAEWNVLNVARRICRGLGWDYEQAFRSKKLQVAHLRPFTKQKRREITEAIIRQEQPYLCIIDGARDMVTSVNDDTICSELVDDFLKWSEIYHCAIGTIIHTNKDGETVRGHLGSELINKAETTLFCKKDGECTKVESIYARNVDIDKFWFDVDKNNAVPRRTTDTLTRSPQYQCGTPAETRALQKLPKKEFNRSQWIAEIRVQANMCGEKTAIKYFDDYVRAGFLRQCYKDSSFYGHFMLYGASPVPEPVAEKNPELELQAEDEQEDTEHDPF